MIIVLPYKETYQLPKNENGTIEAFKRLKFTSLSDILYASRTYLKDYFKSIDIEKLNLTKDYLYNKPLKTLLKNSDIPKFEVSEINIENELVEQAHFSKNLAKLIDNNTKTNMEFGTKVHEILEYLDFKAYNIFDIEDSFIREKVDKFLKSDLLKNIDNATIYKEYEFMYEQDNTEYHGIIDLMLEYENHIDIIDYKLKNTVDENYVKQLNGYKKYISSISKKIVNTYLYSIIDEEITEVR
jgi:ATP-dependent exoDNAse (exonuclease V) beta subunit